MDTTEDLAPGMQVYIASGTNFSGALFELKRGAPLTINVSALIFAPIYGNESISEGRFIGKEVIDTERWNLAAKQAVLGRAAQTLASAETLTMSLTGFLPTLVNVTGVATIKKITATGAGHLIVLKFTEGAKVEAVNNLKIKEAFTATSNDTLTLLCDGVNWVEVGRSVNVP
jgi:hypothetical protein